ncbi:MAG: DUF4388 domain-containing protein [Methylacidiphilales bacterium]|nr:DUF4388 domain-containing protein [Candidatus Methylacidiphilales bacterium]
MSLLGTLSEFPLPEVLISIGTKTGRLRLYDVPPCGVMEIYLYRGKACKLCTGKSTLTGASAIVAELSAIVETGLGMFEFRPGEEELSDTDDTILIHDLIMMLIVQVDEKIAERRALPATQLSYVLATPVPDIWIDHGLEEFYQNSKKHLENGVQSEDLAVSLSLESDLVRTNLNNLRELGLVKLMNGAKNEKISAEISRITNRLQLSTSAHGR